MTGLPLVAPLKDGTTFTLAPRTAAKLASGEKINYVFSYQSASIPLFSAQYKAGYDKTIVERAGDPADERPGHRARVRVGHRRAGPDRSDRGPAQHRPGGLPVHRAARLQRLHGDHQHRR
ncbi:MAG: hypothetical protein WKF78_09045 [Candidatus Limnocylindrales bacterium]